MWHVSRTKTMTELMTLFIMQNIRIYVNGGCILLRAIASMFSFFVSCYLFIFFFFSSSGQMCGCCTNTRSFVCSFRSWFLTVSNRDLSTLTTLRYLFFFFFWGVDALFYITGHLLCTYVWFRTPPVTIYLIVLNTFPQDDWNARTVQR